MSTSPTRQPLSSFSVWFETLRRKLFPQNEVLLQWVTYIILFSTLIVYVINDQEQIGEWRFTLTILGMLGIFLLNVFWFRMEDFFGNKDLTSWAVFLGSAALILFITYTGELFNAVYLVFMVCSQVNIVKPTRQAVLFTAVLALAFPAILKVIGADWESIFSMFISEMIGLTFVVTLSSVLKKYSEETTRTRQLLAELHAANLELEAARQKEKELAVAEERVSMARDIHDGLGHHLTVLSIQLQAAEKHLQANPELAKQAVHQAREEARAALSEVRQSVAALREAPLDGDSLPAALKKMIETFNERAALPADFSTQGKPQPIGASAAQTLYRAAQECLTNAQKHAAGATRVQVRLEWQTDGVSLRVCDDGRNNPNDKEKESGFGLAGMRERVLHLAGSLEAGLQPGGGFCVIIRLPYAKEGK
jgi:signal transduction histidine kinase